MSPIALLALVLADGAPASGAAPSSAAPPSVSVEGTPEIQGALNQRAVDDALAGGMPAVQSCYARALEQAPELGGRVVVELTVLPDGEVLSAATRSTTVHQFRFEACVNRAFMDMDFPALRGGKPAVVQSALRFTPPEDENASVASGE